MAWGGMSPPANELSEVWNRSSAGSTGLAAARIDVEMFRIDIETLRFYIEKSFRAADD